MKNYSILAVLVSIAMGVMIGINSYFGIIILSILLFVIYCIYGISYTKNKRIFLLKNYIFLSIYIYIIRPCTFKNIVIIVDIFLLILLLIGLTKYKNKSIPKNLNIYVLTLLLLGLIGILNPNIINKYNSLIEFRKTIFQFLAIYIGYIYIYSREELNEILKFILIISLPILIYGIKQYIIFTEFDMLYLAQSSADIYTNMYGGKFRAISIFSGPFHFGMFSLIMLCIAIYFMSIYKEKSKYKYYLIAIIAIISALSSLTRVNIVALLVILIVNLIFIFKVGNKKSILILLGLALLSLIMFIIVYSNGLILFNEKNVLYKTFYSLTNIGTDTRFMGRIDTWIKSFEMIFNNIILGNGIGSAADAMSYVAYNHVTPHNMFLKITIEIGIVGLVAFVFLWVVSLKKVIKLNNSYQKLYISVMLVILVNGMTGTTISAYPVNTLFWMIIGSIFVL
ncbi:O-antigen polymerase [[Clostridium] sordellii]|uniref:O-antigen ligase family protein n=1 Tax=Paraclostridium sordellii TaxID=1505 RepID=UPI0005E04FDD|nr:O-antigen ligase family protein [Paeniclostridium sordellii]CEP94203.1 O-antigen polymerase [[Clostridium] sordellii] [Paeniclostridium sordellii]